MAIFGSVESARRAGPGSAAGAVLLALLAIAVLVTSATAAGVRLSLTPAVTFSYFVGDCSLYGYATPDEHLRIIVKDKHGQTRTHVDVVASGGGSWTAGCLPTGPLKPGDTLVARDGSTTVRTFHVPKLSFTIDRQANTASGKGPAGSQFQLTIDDCYPGYITCNGEALQQTFPIPVGGAFTTPLDFGYDVNGGDRFGADWTSTQLDTARILRHVPYLQVRVGKSKVTGEGTPGATVHLTLRSGSGQVRGTASAVPDRDGVWSATFKKNGAPVKVRAGDRAGGDYAGDASLPVHAVALTWDGGDNTVSGTCFPSQKYGSYLYDTDGHRDYTVYGYADVAGDWTSYPLDDASTGWVIKAWCQSARGDVIYATRTVP